MANKPLQRMNACAARYEAHAHDGTVTAAAEPAVAAAERHSGPREGELMPRRPGLRPRLLAAVVRSKTTLASAAERQVVRQTSGTEP